MAKDALDKKTVQRTISIPVNDCLSHSWKDLMHILHGAWKQSTDLANWASQTLRRYDVVRTPQMESLPRWETVDLYALAFGRDRERPARSPEKPPLPVVTAQFGKDGWQGAMQCAASLLRRVQRKYLQERGKIIWRRERRTPEFLYPYPYPVHQAAWVPFYSESNQPVVSLQLPGGRASLRLRGGEELSSQLKVFRELVGGGVAQQEMMLSAQLTHGSNGHQASRKKPGGGHRARFRVMARIVYRREVLENDSTGVAFLTTGTDPFITIQTESRPAPWVLHAPWVRNWIVEHRLFLDSFADDLKFEKRWPAHRRRAFNHYRERRCEKHARRMKTFLQQTAAQVVGLLKRQKVGKLFYTDTCRDFASEFQWYMLAETIKNKCAENGIVFTVVVDDEAASAAETV